MSTVILDLTQPEMAEATKDCKVGDVKSGSFKMEFTAKSETQAVAQLTELNLEYDEEVPVEEEPAEDFQAVKKLKKSSAAPTTGSTYPS